LVGLLLAALLLVGCENGRYSGTLIFDGQHQFGPGDSLPGDLLLRAGAAEFADGSVIDGSVYLVGGTLTLNGTVGGDLVVLDGRVALGPTAVINGDLRYSGETVVLAETAVVRGQIVSGLPLPLDSEPRPASWADWLRSALTGLLLAAVGGLWARWRPRPLQRVTAAAHTHPLVVLSVGLLALLVLPILLVMMALTIVLLPLVLLLGMLILLTVGLGVISLGAALGGWLAAQTSWEIGPGWAAFGGILLLLVAFQLPVVGGVLLLATAVHLFGAVLLTRFGAYSYDPPLRPPDDLEAYRRPCQ
jgi:hypothetical protein